MTSELLGRPYNSDSYISKKMWREIFLVSFFQKRLFETYYQQYFTSEEHFSKANQNKEYNNTSLDSLGVLITLHSTHAISQRKNNHYKTIRTKLRTPYMDAGGLLIFTWH